MTEKPPSSTSRGFDFTFMRFGIQSGFMAASGKTTFDEIGVDVTAPSSWSLFQTI